MEYYFPEFRSKNIDIKQRMFNDICIDINKIDAQTISLIIARSLKVLSAQRERGILDIEAILGYTKKGVIIVRKPSVREGAGLSSVGNTLTAILKSNMAFPFLMEHRGSSRFVGRNQRDSTSRILTRVQPLEFERRDKSRLDAGVSDMALRQSCCLEKCLVSEYKIYISMF